LALFLAAQVSRRDGAAFVGSVREL